MKNKNQTTKEKTKQLLQKILNNDVWKNNDKTNIGIFLNYEVAKALDEAYIEGFEAAEKAFKK